MTDLSFPAGRWHARWIWSQERPGPRQFRRTVAFRRPFDLDRVPSSVPARICADARYALWVNGTEVARGPARVNPHRRRYDVVDLAPFLVEGRNCVAALACFYGRATTWWMPAPMFTTEMRGGGFLLEARLADHEWLVTDAEWKAQLLAGWTDGPPVGGVIGRGPELIDLRSLPAHWLDTGFDDASWPAAEAIDTNGMGEPGNSFPPNYPHGPYAARSHSLLSSRRVEVPRAGESYVHDGVVAGTIEVDLEGPAGAEVVLTCTEFVEGDRASGEGDPLGFTAVLDGTRRTVESFDAYGLQRIVISAPPGVTVHSVAVNERLYPVAGDASFSCSDPRLEQIWSVGRRTVSICSFDSYLDCPTREQRAWTGDSVVHQMVDLATNADWGLARWHPHLTAEPNPDGMLPMAVAGDAEAGDIAVIPDWALHWVHSVWNLWRYFGDRDEILRLLPTVEGVLRWFDPFLTEDGLLTDVVSWVIIDWASVYTEGVCTALNGLYARALVEFAAMAEWLGDAARVRWARARHGAMTAAFEQLWDPDRHLYVDNMLGAKRGVTTSQHAQATAIVGMLAPRARWARLVEVLTDEGALVHAAFNVPDGEASPNLGVHAGGDYLRQGHPAPWWDVDTQVVRAQPFFRYVVHDAIRQAGRPDLIPSLCVDWCTALERCSTSWTETWFGGTVSHGWSSTPTRDLTTSVLGVEPGEPGFATARIEPELGGLSWAAGRVPCPAGFIDVRVEPGTLEVTSPIPFRHGGSEYPAGRHHLARGPA
ncbi:MAG TPA: alpha-L-rhamnosidase C-terminal domain-containing protein [Acidimicrobiales bacterium]|nr:alpha-L-rhamnosidase C-terminal domain-containing protein [Acidimicrobiales bacterium]